MTEDTGKAAAYPPSSIEHRAPPKVTLRDRYETLGEVEGARRYLLLFVSGGLSALAMAPVNFWPVLLLTVPVLVRLTEAAGSKKRAFFTGWAWGAGYFIFGLYWITNALFVAIGQWLWLVPLSLIVGPGVLGIFTALVSLAAYMTRRRGVGFALAFVALWAGCEWLRGHVLTGFPWNLPGYAWADAAPVFQSASLFGLYGLTLLTLLLAALPSVMLSRDGRVARRVTAGAVLAVFATVAVWGGVRLSQATHDVNGDTVIRLVQPNVAQKDKWKAENQLPHFRKLLAMSTDGEGYKKVTHIIWPETAVTFPLEYEKGAVEMIVGIVPKGGMLMTGNTRMVDRNDGSQIDFMNSIVAINSDGKIAATADKFHLVPFGEYVPFRDWIKLSSVSGLIDGTGDFTPGDGPLTVDMDGTPPFTPLICYEIIFPAAVTGADKRPEWLVNVTNDAWYGNSAGPYQHLAAARGRAVEEGLPVARATNTGISAVIDPYGRVVARLGLMREGVVDAALPAPLPPTVYGRYGDLPFLFSLIILFTAGFLVPNGAKGTFK